MASLKIKSSNASNVPTSLGHRELGIHSNQLYFGSSTNTPIRLLNESDLNNFSIPVASTTTVGGIKVGETNISIASCLTSIINPGDNTLYVEFPEVSETSGLYVQSKTIYAMDGA